MCVYGVGIIRHYLTLNRRGKQKDKNIITGRLTVDVPLFVLLLPPPLVLVAIIVFLRLLVMCHPLLMGFRSLIIDIVSLYSC